MGRGVPVCITKLCAYWEQKIYDGEFDHSGGGGGGGGPVVVDATWSSAAERR